METTLGQMASNLKCRVTDAAWAGANTSGSTVGSRSAAHHRALFAGMKSASDSVVEDWLKLVSAKLSEETFHIIVNTSTFHTFQDDSVTHQETCTT